MRHDPTDSRPAQQSGSILSLLGLMDRFYRLMEDRDLAASWAVADLDYIINFLELKDGAAGSAPARETELPVNRVSGPVFRVAKGGLETNPYTAWEIGPGRFLPMPVEK